MVRYSYDSNSDSSHYSSESGPGDEAKSFLPMPIQHRRPLGFFFDPRSIFRGRISKAWRRRVFSAAFVVASVGFLTFIFQSFDAHLLDEWHEKVASKRPLDDETGVLPRHLRPETYMVGDAATAHFRDRLRNDTKYMTSWMGAGFTNDVITMGNLIYLARLSGAVPVIPPFTSHILGDHDPIPFSHVFDVPRLSLAINTPILDFEQIKNLKRSYDEHTVDELGCWDLWEVQEMNSHQPRGSYTPALLNLDISYTRAPSYVKLQPGVPWDQHSSFWSLLKFLFPAGRAEALRNPPADLTRPSEMAKVSQLPDEQMICFDYLYYTCAYEPFEFTRDYSPMWNEVLAHAHFVPELVALAESAIRHALKLAPGAPIPPFIALHARHGDFSDYCGGRPTSECFAPLSAFAAHARSIGDELAGRGAARPAHVIMMSDEHQEAWWADVAAQGWFRLDYKPGVVDIDVGKGKGREGVDVAKRYGNWYPVLIDAVVQSLAQGFVGTRDSTFSIIAQRRVADWNDGGVRMVKWAKPGADSD